MKPHKKEIVRLGWDAVVAYGRVAFALLALLVVLSGCADLAYWNTETFYGLNCRPETLTPDGRCVPVKKGTSGDVHTVQTPRS